MKINYEDIAKRAGVSKSTVSNVFNNKRKVNPETKRIILDIAKELGYVKYEVQTFKSIKLLIYKKTGLVVTETPFFSTLIESIGNECRKHKYEMIIQHIYSKEISSEIIKELTTDDNVKGIILLATELEEDDVRLLEYFFKPYVVVDSYFENIKTNYILVDNYQAAYDATAYLIECGHTQIGFLDSSLRLNNFKSRYDGYKDALEKHDIKICNQIIYRLEPSLSGSYRDMKDILKTKNVNAKAFFIANDVIAFGALRALKEAGVKIPEDLSIVSIDDMPFCQHNEPKLSSVRLYPEAVGRNAVRRLIDLINGDKSRIKIIVGMDLVERESVRKNN